VLGDPVSSLSHLLGAVCVAFYTPKLWRQAGPDPLRRAAVLAFAGSAATMLLFSGLFHALPQESAWRPIARRLDHAGIFFVIAGSFTPAHLVLFRGVGRWGVLAMVWAVALLGVLVKLFWFDLLPRPVSIGAYAALSTCGLLSAMALYKSMGRQRMSSLFLALVAYGCGGLIFALKWPAGMSYGIGYHELWHFAVLLSLVGMYGFVHDQVLDPEGEPTVAVFWPLQVELPDTCLVHGPLGLFGLDVESREQVSPLHRPDGSQPA
jgi:channel protein (hemolysin III family)